MELIFWETINQASYNAMRLQGLITLVVLAGLVIFNLFNITSPKKKEDE